VQERTDFSLRKNLTEPGKKQKWESRKLKFFTADYADGTDWGRSQRSEARGQDQRSEGRKVGKGI
jgi:hypothetical protein